MMTATIVQVLEAAIDIVIVGAAIAAFFAMICAVAIFAGWVIKR